MADLVAVVHEPSSPQRRGLLATIAQAVRGDYVRTARMLGRLDVDVVLLQHEYGIFGGRDGEYVLSFARELAQPLVVTLHTVLSEPTPHQAEVLTELCGEAELVIVMTDTALRLLVDSGACPEEKVRVVPHGAPARLIARAARAREDGRSRSSGGSDGFRLSTFGLISAGKGLETVIEALPAMVERHPELVYTIAGRTHPDVERREGERYRLMLERSCLRARPRNTRRVRRSVPLRSTSSRTCSRTTDVFLTPYASREQIASGALTFAIAAGCAVVSTPYWYAQDMLASGAGRLVPFGDSDALADAVCSYLDHPDGLAAARAEARRIGSTLAWPAVAEATAAVLAEASALAPRRRPAGVADLHLTSLRTDHLLTLVDDVGIVQHAHGIIPNRDSGYCVDDVARLAVVSLALAEPRRRAALDARSSTASLAFLHAAAGERRDAQLHGLRPSLARRAARRRPRRPLDLGARRHPRHRVDPGRRSARRATCSTGSSARSSGDVSLRTAAYTVLGLSRLDSDRLEPAAQALLERLVEQLADAYERSASDDWCWFEDALTYDNARLSQALISGGNALGRADLAERALDSLRWLGDECGLDGRRAPAARAPRTAQGRAGARGRRRAAARRRGPRRGRADRLRDHASGRARTSRDARRSNGSSAATACRSRSTTSRPAAAATGSGSESLNDNEGAESTLAFHQAALLLDAAGVRAGAGELTLAARGSHERKRAVRAPPEQPDPDRRGLAVSR